MCKLAKSKEVCLQFVIDTSMCEWSDHWMQFKSFLCLQPKLQWLNCTLLWTHIIDSLTKDALFFALRPNGRFEQLDQCCQGFSGLWRCIWKAHRWAKHLDWLGNSQKDALSASMSNTRYHAADCSTWNETGSHFMTLDEENGGDCDDSGILQILQDKQFNWFSSQFNVNLHGNIWWNNVKIILTEWKPLQQFVLTSVTSSARALEMTKNQRMIIVNQLFIHNHCGNFKTKSHQEHVWIRDGKSFFDGQHWRAFDFVDSQMWQQNPCHWNACKSWMVQMLWIMIHWMTKHGNQLPMSMGIPSHSSFASQSVNQVNALPVLIVWLHLQRTKSCVQCWMSHWLHLSCWSSILFCWFCHAWISCIVICLQSPWWQKTWNWIQSKGCCGSFDWDMAKAQFGHIKWSHWQCCKDSFEQNIWIVCKIIFGNPRLLMNCNPSHFVLIWLPKTWEDSSTSRSFQWLLFLTMQPVTIAHSINLWKFLPNSMQNSVAQLMKFHSWKQTSFHHSSNSQTIQNPFCIVATMLTKDCSVNHWFVDTHALEADSGCLWFLQVLCNDSHMCSFHPMPVFIHPSVCIAFCNEIETAMDVIGVAFTFDKLFCAGSLQKKENIVKQSKLWSLWKIFFEWTGKWHVPVTSLPVWGWWWRLSSNSINEFFVLELMEWKQLSVAHDFPSWIWRESSPLNAGFSKQSLATECSDCDSELSNLRFEIWANHTPFISFDDPQLVNVGFTHWDWGQVEFGGLSTHVDSVHSEECPMIFSITWCIICDSNFMSGEVLRNAKEQTSCIQLNSNCMHHSHFCTLLAKWETHIELDFAGCLCLLSGNVPLSGLSGAFSPIESKMHWEMTALSASAVCHSFNFRQKCLCIHSMRFQSHLVQYFPHWIEKSHWVCIGEMCFSTNWNASLSSAWWDIAETGLMFWIQILFTSTALPNMIMLTVMFELLQTLHCIISPFWVLLAKPHWLGMWVQPITNQPSSSTQSNLEKALAFILTTTMTVTLKSRALLQWTQSRWWFATSLTHTQPLHSREAFGCLIWPQGQQIPNFWEVLASNENSVAHEIWSAIVHFMCCGRVHPLQPESQLGWYHKALTGPSGDKFHSCGHMVTTVPQSFSGKVRLEGLLLVTLLLATMVRALRTVETRVGGGVPGTAWGIVGV